MVMDFNLNVWIDMKKKKCQEIVEQTKRNITPQQSQADFNFE